MARLRRADHFLYAGLSAVTTWATTTDRMTLHGVTKMGLAPTLGAGVTGRRSPAAPTLLTALAGSTLGDWFMYRESFAATPEEARKRLRLGAASFLVQQAGLIRLMHARGSRPTKATVLPAAIWLVSLAALESAKTRQPGKATAPDPVLSAYGLTLAGMAVLAVETAKPALRQANSPREALRQPAVRVGLGGLLFLFSDTKIIVRQHLLTSERSRAAAEAAVMSTYTAALWLLVDGLERPS